MNEKNYEIFENEMLEKYPFIAGFHFEDEEAGEEHICWFKFPYKSPVSNAPYFHFTSKTWDKYIAYGCEKVTLEDVKTGQIKKENYVFYDGVGKKITLEDYEFLEQVKLENLTLQVGQCITINDILYKHNVEAVVIVDEDMDFVSKIGASWNGDYPDLVMVLAWNIDEYGYVNVYVNPLGKDEEEINERLDNLFQLYQMEPQDLTQTELDVLYNAGMIDD